MARLSIDPGWAMKWAIRLAFVAGALVIGVGWWLSSGCEVAGVANKPRTTTEQTAEADSTVRAGDGSTVDSKTETSVGDAPKADTDIRTGNDSRVTNVTFSLAEYGGYGATGLGALAVGTLWARRQRRITDKALERVMSFIEASRHGEDATPDRIVEALRAFDDAVERRIHKTAKRVGG